MTEEEWLSCTDPQAMLNFLGDKASDRKLRLFAVACCRRIWRLLGETAHRAVEVAEGYADGLVTDRERRAAAESPMLNHAVILTTFVSMSEEIPHLGTVASCSAESAAKTAALARFPLPNPADGSAAYLRAVERLVRSKRWRNAREAEHVQQTHVIRDIFGNPLRPVPLDPAWLSWQGGLVAHLAQAAYGERQLPAGHLDSARLAVLADALEEAGCDNADILTHCRQPGEHVRGCWVVDLLSNKS